MEKKIICAILLVSSIVVLSACGSQDQNAEKVSDTETQSSNDSVPEWLESFYNSSYEYRKSTIVLENDIEDTIAVVEGKVEASPYKEHIKIVEPAESSWSEAWFYGDGDDVTAILNVENDYVLQNTRRSYPYGYGSNLALSKDRTEEYNGISCDVYTAEYTVDLTEQINQESEEAIITEPITAVVSQEYYVDPKKDQLLCMITDSSDRQEKTEIANRVMNDNITVEEAQKVVSVDEVTKEKMEILSYDDSISIDIPEI